MIAALADIALRYLKPQRVARAVEAGQAVFRDGSMLAVDIGDAAVPH